jgi:hypothetical protein
MRFFDSHILFKRLILVPKDMPKSNFEYFLCFIELFAFENLKIDSPLSMTETKKEL